AMYYESLLWIAPPVEIHVSDISISISTRTVRGHESPLAQFAPAYLFKGFRTAIRAPYYEEIATSK
ncbi:unnamed protein product, partial [Nesidiocoris tenuis]